MELLPKTQKLQFGLLTAILVVQPMPQLEAQPITTHMVTHGKVK